MKIDIKLTAIEKDALKETANVGAGNASAALSKLVKKKVNIVVSDLDFVSLKRVSHYVGGPQKLVVSVYTPVKGAMSGNMIVIFPTDSALSLSATVQDREIDTVRKAISKEDQEVLRKVGDILADSYLTSLSDFLEIQVERESSRIISTFGESVIDFIMLTIEDNKEGSGLFIKTRFDIEGTDIQGEFVLLLTTKETFDILQTIRKKMS